MQLHLYGLIVGLAAIVFWQLAEKQAKKNGVDERQVNLVLGWGLLGALIGARFWHVMTDWQLYGSNPIEILFVWQGGLSIFGALAGGAGAIWLKLRDKNRFKQWLDWMIPALPAAQIVGRWANFVNQELVGLPTNLPWGWAVEFAHRPSSYQNFTHFHPLFLYEIILLSLYLLITQHAFFQTLIQKTTRRQPAPGTKFLNYLAFYALIRLALDFLRPDVFRWLYLTLNQWWLVGVLLFWLIWRFQAVLLWRWTIFVWFVYLLTGYGSFIININHQNSTNYQALPATNQVQLLRQQPDHSMQNIQVDSIELTVELVNTPASISQGLSDRAELPADGMLFVLPERRQAEFWMKQMRFPLDIVWVDGGEIVKISPYLNPPAPGQTLDQLPLYSSDQPVELVLETSVGTASHLNWQVGDPVLWLPLTSP